MTSRVRRHEDHVRPLSGLRENPTDLLVDDELGALGIRPTLERPMAEVRRASRTKTDRAQSWREPPVSHHRVASSVAPYRSLAAPVDASPSTRSSAARPPKRTASESYR